MALYEQDIKNTDTAERTELEAYKDAVVKHLDFAKRHLNTLSNLMALYEHGSTEDIRIREIRSDVEKIHEEMTNILYLMDRRKMGR